MHKGIRTPQIDGDCGFIPSIQITEQNETEADTIEEKQFLNLVDY